MLRKKFEREKMVDNWIEIVDEIGKRFSGRFSKVLWLINRTENISTEQTTQIIINYAPLTEKSAMAQLGQKE